VVVSGVGASGEVVGLGGLLEAMELRRLVRGSWDVTSVVAIVFSSLRKILGSEHGEPYVVVVLYTLSEEACLPRCQEIFNVLAELIQD